MKHLILASVVVVLSSLTALAQNAPDAAELTKMLNEFLAGASKNDPAAHDKFWADDLIYTRSSGIRTTKAEILKGLTSAPTPKPDDPVTTYSAEDVQIHQYGTTAIAAFRLMISTTNKDGTKKVGNNLNTGVFLKRGGKWQVVAWQSTTVPLPLAQERQKPAISAAEPASTQKSVVKPVGDRTYLKGTRGGCYYLNAAGGKVYVEHKYCQ